MQSEGIVPSLELFVSVRNAPCFGADRTGITLHVDQEVFQTEWLDHSPEMDFNTAMLVQAGPTDALRFNLHELDHHKMRVNQTDGSEVSHCLATCTIAAKDLLSLDVHEHRQTSVPLRNPDDESLNSQLVENGAELVIKSFVHSGSALDKESALEGLILDLARQSRQLASRTRAMASEREAQEARLNAEIARVTGERDLARQELTEAKEALQANTGDPEREARLLAQVAALQQAVTQHEQELTELTAREEQLKDQLAECKGKREDQERELERLAQELEDLRAAQAASGDGADAVQALLEEEQRNAATLRQQIQDLDDQRKLQQQELDEALAAFRQHNSRYSDLVEEPEEGATVHIAGERAEDSAAGADGEPTLTLNFKARELIKLDFLSLSDPLVGVYVRDAGAEDWQLVGQTDWVKNARECDFEVPVVLSTQGGAEDTRDLKFVVYDVDTADISADNEMGNAVTTVQEVVAGLGEDKQYLLTDGPSAKIKRKLKKAKTHVLVNGELSAGAAPGERSLKMPAQDGAGVSSGAPGEDEEDEEATLASELVRFQRLNEMHANRVKGSDDQSSADAAKAEQERNELQAQLDEARAQLQQQKDDAEAAAAAAAAAAAELAAKQKQEAREAQASLHDIRTHHKQLKQQVADTEFANKQQAEQLEAELAARQASDKDHKKELERLAQELEDLRAAQAASGDGADAVQALLEEEQRNAATLRQQIQDLDDQRKLQQQELDEALAAFRQHNSRYSDLVEEPEEGATVHIAGERAEDSAAGADGEPTLTLNFKARELIKLDFLSLSDPLVGVYVRDAGAEDWQLVGQTDWVKNARECDFEVPVVLSTQGGAEDTRDLKFVVYDVDTADISADNEMGNAVTTVQEVVAGLGEDKQYLLTDGPSAKIKRKLKKAKTHVLVNGELSAGAAPGERSLKMPAQDGAGVSSGAPGEDEEDEEATLASELVRFQRLNEMHANRVKGSDDQSSADAAKAEQERNELQAQLDEARAQLQQQKDDAEAAAAAAAAAAAELAAKQKQEANEAQASLQATQTELDLLKESMGPMDELNANYASMLGVEHKPYGGQSAGAPPAEAEEDDSEEELEEGTQVHMVGVNVAQGLDGNAPSHLKLTLGLRKMIKTDWLSKSDPLVAVFVKEVDGSWGLLGHTEFKKNNHDPDYETTVDVDTFPDDARELQFRVYDVDRRSVKEEHQVCAAYCSMADLAAAAASGEQFEANCAHESNPLLNKKLKKGPTRVLIDAQSIDGCGTQHSAPAVDMGVGYITHQLGQFSELNGLLMKELQNRKQELGTAQQEQAQLQQELDATKAAQGAASEGEGALSAALTAEQAKVAALRKELADAQADKELMSQERADAAAAREVVVQQELDTLSVEIASLREELEQLRKNNAFLQAQVDEQQGEQGQSSAGVNDGPGAEELEEELESTRAELKALQVKSAEDASSLSATEAEKSGLSNKVQELEAAQAAKEAELKTLSEQLEDAKAALSAAQAEHAETQEKLAKQKKSSLVLLQGIKEKESKLKGENSELVQQLEALRASQAAAADGEGALQQQLAQEQGQVHALRQELAQLEESKTQEVRAMSEQHDVTQGQLDHFQGELVALEAAKAQQEQELEGQLDTLRAELKQQHGEVQQAEAALEESKQAHHAALAEMEALKSQAAEAQTQAEEERAAREAAEAQQKQQADEQQQKQQEAQEQEGTASAELQSSLDKAQSSLARLPPLNDRLQKLLTGEQEAQAAAGAEMAQHGGDDADLKEGDAVSISGVPRAEPLPNASTHLSLNLGVRNMIKTDWLSKSDPLVAVFVRDSAEATWGLVGNTEFKKNNHNPDYDTVIELNTAAEDTRQVRLEIYDVDCRTATSDHLVGWAEATMASLREAAAKGEELSLQAVNTDKGSYNKKLKRLKTQILVRAVSAKGTAARQVSATESATAGMGPVERYAYLSQALVEAQEQRQAHAEADANAMQAKLQELQAQLDAKGEGEKGEEDAALQAQIDALTDEVSENALAEQKLKDQLAQAQQQLEVLQAEQGGQASAAAGEGKAATSGSVDDAAKIAELAEQLERLKVANEAANSTINTLVQRHAEIAAMGEEGPVGDADLKTRVGELEKGFEAVAFHNDRYSALLDQAENKKGEGKADTGQGNMVTVHVKGFELVKRRTFGAINVQVALFEMDPSGDWNFICRTESVRGEVSPSMQTPLMVESQGAADPRMLKFAVYDADTDDVGDKHLVGEAMVSASDLWASKAELKFDLSNDNKKQLAKLQKKGSQLTVICDQAGGDAVAAYGDLNNRLEKVLASMKA